MGAQVFPRFQSMMSFYVYPLLYLPPTKLVSRCLSVCVSIHLSVHLSVHPYVFRQNLICSITFQWRHTFQTWYRYSPVWEGVSSRMTFDLDPYLYGHLLMTLPRMRWNHVMERMIFAYIDWHVWIDIRQCHTSTYGIWYMWMVAWKI